MQKHLLIIGPGYSAGYCEAAFAARGYKTSIAARRDDVLADWQSRGHQILDLKKDRPWPGDITQTVTHVLTSVAPPRTGDTGLPDPILAVHQNALARCTALQWMGYLSSTIVYGDHAGRAVDESTPASPGQPRGHRRRDAEKAWEALSEQMDVPLHVIRLAGIYGPGRNAFETIKAGRARRIIKPGQVFSRIHVTDIAHIVTAAAESGLPSGVFNGADTLPAPPQDVLEYAADLLGVPHPPAFDFETADLTPMARTFYSESKRVLSIRLNELGISLTYPTYKEGLTALLETL